MEIDTGTLLYTIFHYGTRKLYNLFSRHAKGLLIYLMLTMKHMLGPRMGWQTVKCYVLAGVVFLHINTSKK